MQDSDNRATLAQAAHWYVRRDAGPLSPEDEGAFQEWLAVPSNRAAFDKLDTAWEKLARVPRPAFLGISQGVSRHRPLWPAIRRQAMAAIAATVAVLGVGYTLDLPMRLEADAVTSVGESKTVTLEDGSTIVLNTGSAIAVDYSNAERRISLLRGEAIFTVAKNPARPFIVDAAGGETRALGTAFAVRRDSDDRAAVTVLESRVAVTSARQGAAPVELSPNETVSYSRDGLGPVEAVNADDETAWRRGKLVFVDRTLGSVVDELNRYHSGRIHVTDAAIGGHLVSGVFDISNPIQVLDALEASLGLHSVRLTDYLILLHR